MIQYSDQVQKLYQPTEYFSCLEDMMNAFAYYDEVLEKQGRNYDEFIGNEQRWSSRFCHYILEIMKQKKLDGDYRYADLDAECEFEKISDDYARDYCHCEDEEVIKNFKEIIKSSKHKRERFYPDIIIHSPGNMMKQLCYIEVKEAHNPDLFDDFDKITHFKNACLYLENHIENKNIHPVFCYHVFVLIGSSLKDKIFNAHKDTRTSLRTYHQDIICIYKEGDDFICCTLGDILDELHVGH